MKYNFKKKISAVFVVAFAAVTLFLMPVSALEWNGTSGGGNNGGGVASNGGYAVSTANEAAGYRFSIVDYYGNTIKSVTTTDIYCSSYSRYSDAYNASKFTNKYNKMQLKALKNTGSFNTSDTKANLYKDSDLGISLPTNTANVINKVNEQSTMEIILKKIGITNGAEGLQKGWKLSVEPLFMVLLENVRHTLTPTEIALYGREKFSGSSNGGSSSNSTSWGFISDYTNRSWPCSLYLDSDESFISKGWNSTSSRLTFDTIIDNGFGLAFAWNDKEDPAKVVDLYPVGVTYWTSKTGGSQVTNLLEGGTYWPRFTYHNKGDIAVTAKVKAWSYPLDKFEVDSKDITIGAESDYTVAGDYSITINNNLYYRNNGEDEKQKYDTYQYNQNVIVHDLSITLTDSKATESNPNNNWATYSHKFSPKQPDINQWIIDRENAASSWITNITD